MARRRMHREARRFLLGLAAFVCCVSLAYMGARWLFQSPPVALSADHVDLAGGEPGLRSIVPAAGGTAKTTNETAKSSGAHGELSSLTKVEPKSAVKADAIDQRLRPPTTQPTTLAKMPISEAHKEMAAGFAARDKKELIVARTHLNKALHGGLPAQDEARVREALADLGEQTIFSRTVFKDDLFARTYTIKRGDSLARIAKRSKVSEDFLAGLNGVSNKNFVRLGASLKVIDGPFNVAVVKKDHLLHLYLQDLYLKSFKVALGKDGNTPTGVWKVVNHQENPDWIDPQGKRWHGNDPQNPLGEFWIGLDGLEGEASGRTGFGIHGTIEPQTIGQDVSLGCVRMGADDIALIYKLLLPGVSIATITD